MPQFSLPDCQVIHYGKAGLIASSEKGGLSTPACTFARGYIRGYQSLSLVYCFGVVVFSKGGKENINTIYKSFS